MWAAGVMCVWLHGLVTLTPRVSAVCRAAPVGLSVISLPSSPGAWVWMGVIRRGGASSSQEGRGGGVVRRGGAGGGVRRGGAGQFRHMWAEAG